MNRLSLVFRRTVWVAGALASALGTAHAQLVDFSTVNQAAVTSTSGQNFSLGSSGTLNVRLVSGAVSGIMPGASPDTTGFDVQQTSANLTPVDFRFTFSAPQTFTITQNESLTYYETNAFSLASGAWSVLSYSGATLTTSNGGSQVSFLGTTNSAPYGTYQIMGTGSTYDFMVTNTAGIQNYGSAISLRLTNQSSAPEPGSVALVALGGVSLLGSAVRRRRS